MFGIIKKDLYFIIKAFVVWRIFLLFTQDISIRYLPLQENFLGGGFHNYINNPYFWGYVNFDGEHFLSIAMSGYRDLQYFFFPLYPMIVGTISKVLGLKMFGTALIGLGVSHILFFIALLGLFKISLLIGDNKNRRKKARQLILLVLLFPTSFYFVSMYSESLFLALAVWSFYFVKTKNYLLAFLLSGLATATRVVGLSVFAGVFIQFIIENDIVRLPLKVRPLKLKTFAFILTGLSGILVYMYYLWVKTGDPLNFFNNVGIYGDQRTAGLILLPQVFYRYIFKIIPNVDYSYLPIVFTTYLELITAIVFGVVLGMSALGNMGYHKFKRLRLNWGYLVFAILAYMIPTFTGSFSSLPRYVLIIFPVYILFAKFSYKYSFKVSILIFTILSLLLATSFSLFSRGYWIS